MSGHSSNMNSEQPSNTFIYRRLKTPLLHKKNINSRPKHQGKLCAQFEELSSNWHFHALLHMHSCTNLWAVVLMETKGLLDFFFIFCTLLAINQVERKKHRQTPANGTVYYICIGIWIITHTHTRLETKLTTCRLGGGTRVGQKQKNISLDNQSCHHSGKYVQRNRAQWKRSF